MGAGTTISRPPGASVQSTVARLPIMIEMNNAKNNQIHSGIDMNELARVRLRQLQVFVEVARLSSVGRTAESLNMTQPAVTRTLRELERVCGKPLTVREGRGIRLTAHGELFARHAANSLAAARNGLAALASLDAVGGPELRIGALPTVSATLMPEAIARFLSTGARNRPVVIAGENQVLLDHLFHRRLDLVLGRLAAPERMQGLMFEPLYHDRVVFVIDSDHPLAGRSRVSDRDMTPFALLVPTRGSIIRPLVDRLFIEQGFAEPPRVVETVSASFGRAFVREHGAIWIISRGVVASEIESGAFTVLPIDTGSTVGAVGLHRRIGAEQMPAVDIMTSILKSMLPGP